MEFNYEQIKKYIKGELSPEELQNFEQEIAGNPSLKEEIALYKDVEESLSPHFKFEQQDAAVEATLAQLSQKYVNKDIEHPFEKTAEKKVETTQNNKSTITRRLFSFAALAAAAALLLFLFNPFTNQVSPLQLAEQNFDLYEVDAFMGGGDNAEIAWNNSVKYYRSEDYENALQNLNIFLKDNPNHKEALLAKGNAQFKLNQTEAAIQTFQQIKNSKLAEWYLALAYLKNNEVEKAKLLLQNLSDNSKYDEKAKALLNDL